MTNKTNYCCYNSIAVGDLLKIAGSSLSNHFKVLSGQKEPKLSQTLLIIAFVTDTSVNVLQCNINFIQHREFGHNTSDEIDNDDKKTG